MAFFPKNIFHISNTYNFEGKFLGYWIEIFEHWKNVFCSIASYFYYFPLSVSYRYGNLYLPIPITIPIRHFTYRQNRNICRYRYIGRYRYRNCISGTLADSTKLWWWQCGIWAWPWMVASVWYRAEKKRELPAELDRHSRLEMTSNFIYFSFKVF